MTHARTFLHPNDHRYEYDPYTNRITITDPEGVQVVEELSDSLANRLVHQGVPEVLWRRPAYVGKPV